MENAVENPGFDAQQLLRKGKTHSLREQMQKFVSEHEAGEDFKELREEASNGQNVSEIVKKGREERI